MNISCSWEGTRQIIDNKTCSCFPGYTSDDCSDIIPYWIGLNWFMFILFLLSYASILGWIILRLIHYTLQRKSKNTHVITLAFISHIFVLIAVISRIIFLFIHSSTRTMDYHSMMDHKLTGLLISIFNQFILALLMASCSLIIGFWLHLSLSKFYINMAKRTRTICISAAVLVLAIDTIGFILPLVTPNNGNIITIIVVIPLIITVIGYIVMAIILKCVTSKNKSNDSNLASKQKFFQRIIILISILWIFAIATAAYSGAGWGKELIPTYIIWVYFLVELSIVFCVHLMLSRKYPPWTIIMELLNKKVSNSTNMSKVTDTNKTTESV